MGLQLLKTPHRVSESCYRIRKFSGVEKVVCSCVDDNGKLWRIIPRVTAWGEKLGSFLLFLKYSRLFLICTYRNLSSFMLMNKTTCCYSLDDVVLVFLVRARARACVCVYTLVRSRDTISSSFTYIETRLFFTFKPPMCVRVCVFRFAFASLLLRWCGQNRKFQNFHVVNHTVICILHRESCGKVSVTTNLLLCMQRSYGDRFMYKSSWL